ncbi:penicillin-binding protein [Mesobacillus subterraneus]|uniref:penicillin-binding protein n=1 Tax=Mesobacillus subterraneus TaxID=285983 RepID=UPI00203B5D56|nr:penicillin-binding protein [Mesobacillus subterraneus]MCM3665733.1 penicillin-binding protein [Mesobacillus subterraneus]MCM3684478.1 penicillin-binding protein [Mesobacillus subterraneus]
MIKKQPHMNAGAAVLFVIFSLLFFILIFRFVTIQVTGEVHGQALAAKAQQKYTNEKVIEAVRGTIFDRKGEVVAEDTTAYTLVAILDNSVTTNKKKPKHVTDPGMTANKLAKYLDMSESEIYNRLKKEGPFQVEFGKAGRDISNQTKREIEDLKLPGIIFLRDSKRFYPNGIFSSHLVGFVEKKETKDKKIITSGKLGIEKTLNDELTGKNGSLSFESDLWGFLLPDEEKKITPAQNGDNVYLTIDKKIQTFVEDAVNRVDEEYKPKNIIVVVADPKTGDILGMAQRPTFHPTTREGLDKSWHNDVVEKPIEPGSTMKIFTLAAAVEEKKWNPNEPYKSGSYKVTEKSGSIGDHNGRQGWGTISFLEGIQRSSNVAVAKLVNEKIGTEKFREYLTAFGFDKPTGIDLPNEAVGKIQYQWPIEKITTSYGQGSTVTPIQLVQAATAVANDGKMMKPRVIDKVVDSTTGKIVKETNPVPAGQPISAETAKEVRDVLETVITSEHGTGKSYAIEGYKVAGKTGTANLTQNGKYLGGANDYLFSFMGMAPKDDPKLVVYVAVQQPEVDHYYKGSIPVSMIFKSVMKSSLQYLNIKPASMEKADSSAVPDISEMDAAEAKKLLESKGFETVIIGAGHQVEDQLPKADTIALEGEKVIIKASGVKTYPDLTNWSLRDVMKLAQITGVRLNKAGSGYVTKQNLKPGSPINEGENLIVELETPLQQFEKSLKKEEPNEETEEVGG